MDHAALEQAPEEGDPPLTPGARIDAGAPLAGMLWMALSSSLFAVMNVLTRLASARVPWSEVAAVRIGRSVQERTKVALRIEPPVDGYRMLDFASIDPIVEAGYQHAAAHVEGWRQALLGG